MCGLTGFSRHPNAPHLLRSVAIFTNLLVRTQHRGHHATGLAMLGGAHPILLKKAVDAQMFVNSVPYTQALDKVDRLTQVMLGHTRHATHRNGHVDEAAHPFRMGRVVGAHNGVIHNWREVEKELHGQDAAPVWINDSQAAFAVLDRWKDPVKGLDLLDGWWALTWTRGRRLYMCRTSAVELNVAYVGAWQTMFWNSKRAVLLRTLEDAGLSGADVDSWTLKPDTVYGYDPTRFTKESANAERTEATFRGRTQCRVNGARPNEVVRIGGYSTTRTTNKPKVRVYPDGTQWDSYSAEQKPLDTSKLWDVIASQQLALSRLNDRVETLEAEVAHMYELLNDAYPEVFEAGGPEQERDPRQLDAFVDDSPYRPDDTLDLEGAVCYECGHGAQPDNPLLMESRGRYVHDVCVMAAN